MMQKDPPFDPKQSRISQMGRVAADAPARAWPGMPLGLDIKARIAEIDRGALDRYRLARLRAELVKADVAGALLADPMNIRYATGTRNMAVWTMHAPGGRYAFVATQGPVVLFEFGASKHVSAGSSVVDETRISTPWFYFLAGPRVAEKTAIWAKEVAELVTRHGGKNRRLAIDRCEPWGAALLARQGIELIDAQVPIEKARTVKSAEEIKCLRLAMDVCDIAIDRIRTNIAPGITENQLWAILHDTNIAHDGEWIECRLLASGERTNPWFQECGNRVIEPGDIVGFDTDMVGPFGYLADVSRSIVCPGRKPTAEQRKLYELAQEQVLFNTDLIRPGLTFREFGEACWPVPEAFVPNRYMMMVHGVGLVDEYPSLAYAQDFAEWGYDGVFEENMVVSIESYIGEVGHREGVKLEQQVLITRNGAVPMSKAPFVDAIEV
ncbi:Xaa-Pro aminopeptidase [Rhizobiales bacterium GAS191]|nr:Xaa-Pro aminopeptidase [Rhizobiales bacterium GAS113]SEC92137.1 Xaa-Pro aminopeptidase [Rhizobiales bacterium GAS191]